MIQNSIGIPVNPVCRSSLALSTCQGVTGSDCISQKFLPSSETDGADMSFKNLYSLFEILKNIYLNL